MDRYEVRALGITEETFYDYFEALRYKDKLIYLGYEDVEFIDHEEQRYG